MKTVYQDAASGADLSGVVVTGAWEAALVNTLNPGDRVLAFRYRAVRRVVDEGRAEPGDWMWIWWRATRRVGVELASLAERLGGGSRA